MLFTGSEVDCGLFRLLLLRTFGELVLLLFLVDEGVNAVVVAVAVVVLVVVGIANTTPKASMSALACEI